MVIFRETYCQLKERPYYANWYGVVNIKDEEGHYKSPDIKILWIKQDYSFLNYLAIANRNLFLIAPLCSRVLRLSTCEQKYLRRVQR